MAAVLTAPRRVTRRRRLSVERAMTELALGSRRGRSFDRVQRLLAPVQPTSRPTRARTDARE